ncbi:TIGR01777 family oxidoreductase [Caenimonas sp. SL110]|uniref:TIGR01777 family oxidoreductase n=1 Tax=Caenimonas sp. SL110 TaxID=1450524 RepID=UPI00069CD035|nr:TIGR01777 family oxidoreductase [Caenimonas sp. SL110]
MRILMTGATGLIGRELGKALASRGDSLVCLVRDVSAARRRLPFPATCHAWDHTRAVPAQALHGVDAVVNLAGEPVADKRWTTAQKQLISDSRVLGTQQLVRAVLEHGHGVAAFVQGSAIGYYGERGDERLTASSAKGSGFAADFVKAWEDTLEPLATQRPRMRVPIVRTGVVLARDGGALGKMLPMFRLSLAGQLASGKQWMSWIHLEDIIGLFMHSLDAAPSGVLEGVAPQPATNRQFTKALCRSLGVIENVPLPRPAIAVMFGERADIVIGSTRVEPMATRASGFRFQFETIESALENLLAPLRGGVHLRVWEQWVATTEADLRPFLFGAANLKAWDPPRRFIDARASGFGALWEHTHDFIPMAGGTLLRDTVRYRLPARWLGALAGGGKVASDLERVFDRRARMIDERFKAS